MMQILLTGATGFIGTALCEQLVKDGHQVIAYVRNRARAKKQLGDAVSLTRSLRNIPPTQKIDAVINLAGAPIAGGVWTKAKRKILIESRVDTTKSLGALMTRLDVKPQVVISASAVGYYGRCGDDLITEDAAPQDIFMSQLCVAWEAAAKDACFDDVRLVIPRISIVLGKGGGALSKLLLPFKLGLGARLGNGQNYFPWIHRTDLINFIIAALENEAISGPYNMVTNDSHTQDSFNRRLAQTLRRPYFIRVPAVILRTVLGEMSDLFLAGQHLSNEKLDSTGFQSKFSKLTDALNDSV